MNKPWKLVRVEASCVPYERTTYDVYVKRVRVHECRTRDEAKRLQDDLERIMAELWVNGVECGMKLASGSDE